MPERVAQAIKSIAGAVVLAVVPVAGSVQGEPMSAGGVLTSLIGEYGTKAWFNVIVR